VERCRARGDALRGFGLVVGSIVDPASIGNQHIRAHASEGRLFRTAVADAARSAGFDSTVFVERELHEKAEHALRIPVDQLRAKLTELGRVVDGSWRAEDKLAALAAWLVLAKGPRIR
jgi:hypothetical protein